MKRNRLKYPILIVGIAILLIMAMLGGCGALDGMQNHETEPSVSATVTSTEESTEGGNDNKRDPSYYIEEVYSEQIGRYYTPLWELWDVSKYIENELCVIPSFYYTGNSLENVGFGLVDLDNDGSWELVIGAIMNADTDPSIFEIWTLKNGEPVMLVQGNSDNRYVLQCVEEEQAWYVVSEISINIASYATYYMTLEEGEHKVTEGIVYDAFADEENPWFKACDLDRDTSNDTPIDAKTANEILETNRQFYTAPEYMPYTQYPSGEEHTPQTTPEQMLYESVEELSQRFGLDIRVPKQDELTYSHYDAFALTDLAVMSATLDTLEENLSLYPEGFFRQLTYGPIESIRVELVGGLAKQEDTNLDLASTDAFAQNMGEYYLVVFNGLTISPFGIFHEFSHLTNARLNWDSMNRQDALFSEEAWLALQPEGFSYVGNYVNVPVEYQVYLESGYFLDEYSMTFASEDRAQLMSAAMENKAQEFEAGSGRRAKLQFYADCIRDCFNTEGWPETTLWEQVLK